MAVQKTQPINHTSLTYRRFSLWLFALILGIFLFIGVVAYVVIRNSAYDNLSQTHSLVLSDVSSQMDNHLAGLMRELDALAQDETVRRFVQETEASRSALFLRNTALGRFVDKIESLPGALRSLRYLSATGQAGISAVNTARGVEILTDSAIILPPETLDPILASGQVVPYLFSPYELREVGALTTDEQPVYALVFPMYDNETTPAQPLGVLYAEIPSNYLLSVVNSALDSPLFGTSGRQLILVNNVGLPLADSSILDQNRLYGPLAQLETSTTGQTLLELIGFLQVSPNDLTVDSGADRVVSTIAFDVPLKTAEGPWRLAIVDNPAQVFNNTNSLSLLLLVGSLFAGLIVAVVVSSILRRVMQPLERATALVRQYTDGVATPADSVDDLLTQAIVQISDSAQTMMREISLERERLKNNLDIVARVSRESAAPQDIDGVMNRIIDLICNQESLQHAQVFLKDDVGYETVLMYTRDAVAREQLARGGRPPIQADSVVRRVVQQGRVEVDNSLDRGESDQLRSPIANGMRSRLVLPLWQDDSIIGALDIQSRTIGLFQQEDIQAFELLADQISKTLYNEQLMRQTAERVQQIDRLNQELTRSAWQDLEQKLGVEQAYHYDLLAVRPDMPESMPEKTLNVPIRIRGEVIGELAVAPPPDGITPDEELVLQAMTDRVSLAIERARLFQETQMSLRETEQLYNITRRINEAAALEAVFQTVTEHLMNAARATQRILVLLARPQPSLSAPFMECVYEWVAPDSLKLMGTGTQFETEILPYASLASAGMELVADVRGDLSFQPDSVTWFMQQGVESLMLAPLELRQQWFGVLVCESSQKSAFDEQHSRFIHAIADQVAIAIENRSLINSLENEREVLSSILDTMPSGVVVLDAETLVPLQVNDHIESLLGYSIDMTQPFDARRYGLHRTGTTLLYDNEDLPIYQAARQGTLAFADDIVVLHENGDRIDLLLNAAPIRESDGHISMIVAAFENISSLRGLENALQDNLRETIALYEATRSLSEANEIEEVLDVTLSQLLMIEPTDAAIITREAELAYTVPVRTISGNDSLFHLPVNLLDDVQAVWISDVSKTELLTQAEREQLLAREVNAMAILPLRPRSQAATTAWMVVTYNEPRDIESFSGRYLMTLADGAEVALDSRYLFNATEAALHEASILYEASRSLANAASAQDIVRIAYEHLAHTETDNIFLAVLSTAAWDMPGAAATVTASWSRDDNEFDLAGVVFSPDQFPAWDLLTTPELLVIDDLASADQLDELSRMGVESLGAYSVAVMPLRITNRALGVMWMSSSVPHRYTDHERRILRSFAEQTSLSMDAARLYDQAERRAGQLQTSAQVSQFASSILDLDMLLPRLVDLIQSAFNYDHVQIFLMDREDRFAVLRASTGEAGRRLLSIQHKLEKGSSSVIGAVTAKGEPVVALDTGTVDVIHRPNPYLPHTRSEMALPLVIKGRVVGALDVQSNQANAFSEEDVSVLTTLAAQISVAIDNARLFEQAENRANDMSLLFDVTSSAASAETLSEALANVTGDLRESLHALAAGIYLPMFYVDELTGNTQVTMRPEAIAGYAGDLAELPEIPVGDESNLIGLVASSFRSVIVDYVRQEPAYQPLDAGAQSAIVVPLASAGQIVGVVVLESEKPTAYNQEMLTLIQTMGGTLTAIIQNQQLLERVQETNDQLLEMDRIKSEFLANMSHELRTPLNSIIGFSRVILKGIDGPLTEMQEQDLTTIYNSGQHLLNLINDILDQAKIAAGKMDIKAEPFDIKPVVEGVRSIGIGLVKDKPIDIRIEMESGLPMVYGDEFRTRQVLLNLLSNAGKFTHEGSITFRIFRARHSVSGADMVQIDVVDSGIGIAEKDIPLLFEAFRQVDSSLTRTAGGTGLGLPISKALIELQGGEMDVTSVVNHGSTFSISIPVNVEVEDSVPHTPETDEQLIVEPVNGHNGHNNGDGPKEDMRRTTTMPSLMPAKRQVLVIEDNADRVDQFRRALQREGFDVFAASIPLEAEAMASGLRPSVIIMDVNFSGGAGWDILRKLKERDDTFDIPVVVVTLEDEQQRALESGAFAYMQHPIIPEELVDVVLEAEKDSLTDRILIIDDQPESTRLLRQILHEHGEYRVFEASNGIEGVSMVARRRPDLVILDLRMPEMDGFAVLDELRANIETASIPVLVVTSDTLNADEENQLGGIDILYKTNLSLETSEQFVEDVQVYLKRTGD